MTPARKQPATTSPSHDPPYTHRGHAAGIREAHAPTRASVSHPPFHRYYIKTTVQPLRYWGLIILCFSKIVPAIFEHITRSVFGCVFGVNCRDAGKSRYPSPSAKANSHFLCGFGHKCGAKRRERTQMLRIRKVSTESARLGRSRSSSRQTSSVIPLVGTGDRCDQRQHRGKCPP